MTVDVSLISPPSRRADHRRPPLALMYLAAYLEENGVFSEIIDRESGRAAGPDLSPDEATESVLERLRSSKPWLVGITCYTPEYMEVMALAGAIKGALPGIVVVVGGVHPTLRPADFLFIGSPVDFAVVGEGEVTLYELVRALSSGTAPAGLPGLATAGEGDELLSGPPRPLIEDLDLLPFPSFEKVDMDYYTMPNPYAIRGIPLSSFYVAFGRGCPFNCSFCVAKHLRKLSGPGRHVRYRSARRAVDEVQTLKDRYRIDGFYIIDDTFSASHRHASEFCDEMERRKLRLLWGCTTRVSQVDDELLRKMRRAGCVQVDFGVESGSERCLERVNKEIDLGQIRRAFDSCRDVGMRTFANILVNIPGETEEDLGRTVDLLDELNPSVCAINVLTPYIGTDIYEECGLELLPEDYAVLGKSPLEIIRDERFLFAGHDLDIKDFVDANFRRFNRLGNFARFLTSRTYLAQLARSRRKLDYLRMVPEWYRELKKQRAPIEVP